MVTESWEKENDYARLKTKGFRRSVLATNSTGYFTVDEINLDSTSCHDMNRGRKVMISNSEIIVGNARLEIQYVQTV